MPRNLFRANRVLSRAERTKALADKASSAAMKELCEKNARLKLSTESLLRQLAEKGDFLKSLRIRVRHDDYRWSDTYCVQVAFSAREIDYLYLDNADRHPNRSHFLRMLGDDVACKFVRAAEEALNGHRI